MSNIEYLFEEHSHLPSPYQLEKQKRLHSQTEYEIRIYQENQISNINQFKTKKNGKLD